MNKELFAQAIISGLGLPISQPRINILLAWFNAENTKALNNPLATTWKKTGSTFFNCLDKGKNLSDTANCKIGVQNFPSESVGVQATIDTIKLSYYKPIVQALKDNKKTFDYNNDELTKSFSTWGTGYKNFLGQFAKYGTVTGKPSTSNKTDEDETKSSKGIYWLLGLAAAYGIYKYNKRTN